MDSSPTTTGLVPVLWTKFVAFIEAHTLRELALYAGLSFLAGLLSAAALDLTAVVDAMTLLVTWRHNALPTIALIFAGVYQLPRFVPRAWDALLESLESLFSPEEGTEAGETIEGIPTGELLDHLFLARTFKRGEIEEKFGVPRHRIERLAAKLEAIGVLTRGANNARVLADMARQEVAGLLIGKESADELTAFKIVRPLPHSPTPLFQTRPLTNG